MFKKSFLSFLFLVSLQVQARDLSICQNEELHDAKTGQLLRVFSNNSDCEKVLAKSKEGLYCRGSDLVDLRTGALVRYFSSAEACEQLLGAAR